MRYVRFYYDMVLLFIIRVAPDREILNPDLEISSNFRLDRTTPLSVIDFLAQSFELEEHAVSHCVLSCVDCTSFFSLPSSPCVSSDLKTATTERYSTASWH